MASNAHRLLRLRLEIADVEIPITRTLEIDASTPLERLHHVIQIAFGWSDRARHVFTDRRTAAQAWPDKFGTAYGSFGQQRVWEMDHECRNRGHISECEWTSTIAGVFDTITPSATHSAFGDDAPVLFYEYGIETRCPAYEYGEPCFGCAPGRVPGPRLDRRRVIAWSGSAVEVGTPYRERAARLGPRAPRGGVFRLGL